MLNMENGYIIPLTVSCPEYISAPYKIIYSYPTCLFIHTILSPQGKKQGGGGDQSKKKGREITERKEERRINKQKESISSRALVPREAMPMSVPRLTETDAANITIMFSYAAKYASCVLVFTRYTLIHRSQFLLISLIFSDGKTRFRQRRKMVSLSLIHDGKKRERLK